METTIFLLVAAGILLVGALAPSNNQSEYMIVSVQQPQPRLGCLPVVAIIGLCWLALVLLNGS